MVHGRRSQIWVLVYVEDSSIRACPYLFPLSREANNKGPSLAPLFSSAWDLSAGSIYVPARRCVG